MLQASAARAQSVRRSEPLFELGIGARWMGAESLGTKNATETTGVGGMSTLFSTSSELAGAAGIDGRAGIRVSRSWSVEAEASYLKPQLRIAVSGDTEGAAAVTAVETIEQFTIGGNVVWRLPGRRWSPRFARSRSPAAVTCASSMRRRRSWKPAGSTSSAAASVHCSSRTVFARKALASAPTCRGLIRSKGVAFDGGSKLSPDVGVSLFVRF